jgi:nitrite reductase/ring-hydroxylating ferredoxin subunit
MDMPSKEFALAGTLEELKVKGQLVVHGGHRPILVIYDRGRVFALDNRCPHMGFPLERGSVEDGILTCHWHHARFDLESGCTFDLWADDVPICPVELRNGEVWVKTTFGHADPAAHWHQRLADGLAHDLGLVIAKAVHGQLAGEVLHADIVRQVALFGAQNRDGWGVGLTILTALANLLPVMQEEEAYLALFHGARRVAADCDGEAPRRVTTQKSLNINSVWSPDARAIAYTSFRRGQPQIFISNIYEGTLNELTRPPGQNVLPSFSPDGKVLTITLRSDAK